MPRAAWPTVIAVLVVAGLAVALASNWAGLAGQEHRLQQASWLLPGLVALHLSQLLLSVLGWRALFKGAGPDIGPGIGPAIGPAIGIGTFHRLRVVRVGIDSLLPVAQEGGFVLAAVALGLPAGPALALSLVKRIREVLVGLIGLALAPGLAHGAGVSVGLTAALAAALPVCSAGLVMAGVLAVWRFTRRPAHPDGACPPSRAGQPAWAQAASATPSCPAR